MTRPVHNAARHLGHRERVTFEQLHEGLPGVQQKPGDFVGLVVANGLGLNMTEPRVCYPHRCGTLVEKLKHGSFGRDEIPSEGMNVGSKPFDFYTPPEWVGLIDRVLDEEMAAADAVHDFKPIYLRSHR